MHVHTSLDQFYTLIGDPSLCLTPQCPEQKQECKREMGAECVFVHVFVLCMTEGWSSCEYWMTCIAFLVLPVLIDLLSGSELDGRRIDVKYDKFA